MKPSQKSAGIFAGRSILLVEDDPLIALNQTRLLEHAGYRVTAVHDSGKALEHLELASHDFDLVLMDIDLGDGRDGPETAHEILKIREIPIVFLSGHSEQTYVERTHGLESYGFVLKNAGNSVLMASISMAFRLWDSRQKQLSEERQYRVLVESSPDIIMRFDQNCRYLYVSPSICLLSPEPPEFFIGKRLDEVGHSSELRERWENSISNVFFTNESIEQEIRLQHEGKTLDLNWRLIPEKDEHGRVMTVLSIIRDISPQKRAEAYRFQNELRMAFLLDLYSHASQLTEQEIGDRAVRMARELSGSRNGYLYFANSGDPRAETDADLAECLEKRTQILRESTDETEEPSPRQILLPVSERDQVQMVLCVSGKRTPYDDTDRAQLQLAANEVFRMISRRKADEALQESYRQYQSILNTASDGFFMVDETGHFIDANEVYVTMTGYRRSELLKMNIATLERDTEAKDSQTLQRQVIAMGKWRHETQQRRKNGQLIDLEISTTYIASSHRFVSFVRDISERKKTDRNLQRMQHLLSETGRIARIGGWEYDLESKRMAWTDEVFRIHDLSLEFEPTLDRSMAFLEGNSLTRFSEAFRQVLEAQKPFDLELSLRSANGRIKTVRVIGSPVTRQETLASVAGTIQDITDLQMATNQARESDQRLDRFYNLSPDMLGIIDFESHFVSLNTAWERITGFPLNQLLGKRFTDYLHPDELDKTMEAWQIAQNESRSGFINRFRTSDGSYKWIEWRSIPTDGMLYTAGRDISEARNIQSKLGHEVRRSHSLLELYQGKFESGTELMKKALELVLGLFDSQFGYLHIIDKPGKAVQTSFWSKEAAESCDMPADSGHNLPKGGIWADSLRLRRPVIHNDFQLLPKHSGYPKGHTHIARHLGVPVFEGKKVRLIVGVANKVEPYDDEDSRQLGLFMQEAWKLAKERFSDFPL